MLKVLKTIFTIVLFAVLTFAVFILVTSKTEVLAGIRSFTVVSGSMEPTIPVGAIVFVQKQPSYKPGDIIAFKNKAGLTVTHRLSQTSTTNGQVFYQTKGDANKKDDAELIPATTIIGKEIISVPKIGQLAALLKNPYAFIFLIVTPTIIFIGLEILNIKNEMVKEIEKKLRKQMELVAIFLVFMTFVSLHAAHAFFTDTATSTGNTFTAAASFTGGETAPQNIANYVVISEVQIDGGTGEPNNNDFIELYNPTVLAISLNTMRLVKRTAGSSNDDNIFTFTASHTIPAHGYFLWGHKSETNTFADTILADVSSASTLATNNSIALRQGDLDSGIIIDALSWDSAASSLKEGIEFSPDPTANHSIERKALSASTNGTMEGGGDSSKGNGFDTDNNSTDFVSRTTPQPQNSGSATETP